MLTNTPEWQLFINENKQRLRYAKRMHRVKLTIAYYVLVVWYLIILPIIAIIYIGDIYDWRPASVFMSGFGLLVVGAAVSAIVVCCFQDNGDFRAWILGNYSSIDGD